MKFDPTLHALRGDDAAQRARQAKVAAAMARCRRDPALGPVLRDLEAYGAGVSLEDCAALTALLAGGEEARNAIAPLVRALLALLRDEPLTELLFRHQTRKGFHVLQLAGKGRATLALALHEPGRSDAGAPLATFPDAERHEIVLSGSADAETVTIVTDCGEGAVIERTTLKLEAGDTLICAGPMHSRRIIAVNGCLQTLRLARVAPSPQPTRQFDLSTGALVHRASGDRRESRHEMMMALLGRMGRRDAAPVLACAARHGSEHFRWQALRECLGLDAGVGFRELGLVAASPEDPLSALAADVRAQLLEAHPQLARTEAEPCPA